MQQGHSRQKQQLARLDDRFALLTGGPRTDLPRQQSLLASLAWSYELLTVAEQALLAVPAQGPPPRADTGAAAAGAYHTPRHR